MTPLAELSFTLRAFSRSPSCSVSPPSTLLSSFCPFSSCFFAPAYSITTDATDSSLSTSLLRRDISRGWMNNQDIKVKSRTSRQKDAYSKHPFVPNVWESVASFHDIKNIHHDDIHLAQQFHQGLHLNVITIFIVHCSTRKISKRETKYLKIL